MLVQTKRGDHSLGEMWHVKSYAPYVKLLGGKQMHVYDPHTVHNGPQILNEYMERDEIISVGLNVYNISSQTMV